MKNKNYIWRNLACQKKKWKKEQKPADKIEPKFKVGDWVINTITKEVEQVIELTDCEYICSGHLIISFNNQHLLKKWIKKIEQGLEWNEEDERMFNSALWHIKNSCGNQGKNSGEFEVYNWLKSIKDRVLPQSKQEWSEEDEERMHNLIQHLKIEYSDCKWLEETIYWLKSLR